MPGRQAKLTAPVPAGEIRRWRREALKPASVCSTTPPRAARPDPGRSGGAPWAARFPARRYERRRPEKTILHKIVSENLESWLQERYARGDECRQRSRCRPSFALERLSVIRGPAGRSRQANELGESPPRRRKNATPGGSRECRKPLFGSQTTGAISPRATHQLRNRCGSAIGWAILL